LRARFAAKQSKNGAAMLPITNTYNRRINKMSKNILIVDNDCDSLKSSKKALEGAGFTVSEATTSEEALKKLEGSKPDLILTEVMLEHKDSGFSLCYLAKKKLPSTPIIILSNVVSETGISFNLASPEEKDWIKAEEFLHKPVNPATLVSKVKRYLKA
jgi:CheY-like chemotaxis protein